MSGRIKLVAGVIGGIAFAAVVGWAVFRWIEADGGDSTTSAPQAVPILAPAEERVLSDDIVTTGTARLGTPEEMTTAESELKDEPGVVSGLPAPGTELNEGDLVYTVSDRPVFLLTGDEPMERDLGPGVSGDDVEQLEEALVRLEFDPGEVDGTWDESTEEAVSEWYEESGFAAFEAAEASAVSDVESELEDAESAVEEAEAAVLEAEASLAEADSDYMEAFEAHNEAIANLNSVEAAAEANIAAAEAEVEAREAALAALEENDGTDEELAAAEEALELAEAAAEEAEATAESEIEDAEEELDEAASEEESAIEEITGAEEELAEADEALLEVYEEFDSITADLAEAKEETVVQVPADEIIFVAAAPVRISETEPGAEGEPPVLIVMNTAVAFDASLSLEEAMIARPGMDVLVDEPDLSEKFIGTISRVADEPGTDGVDENHVYVEVLVEGLPPSIEGGTVSLVVTVDSTGDSVLVVPTSAVSLSEDGSSRVQRDNEGELEYVTVEPGLSVNGLVTVEPIEGDLEAGDLVVVGYSDDAQVSH
jgi:multidrug efflux pump subunit AcrA (membrane-fusion protein)